MMKCDALIELFFSISSLSLRLHGQLFQMLQVFCPRKDLVWRRESLPSRGRAFAERALKRAELIPIRWASTCQSCPQTILKSYFVLDLDPSLFWLGFSRSPGGAWHWTNGAPNNYTDWHPGQPDAGSQHCTVHNYRDSGQWDNSGCYTERNVVCEIHPRWKIEPRGLWVNFIVYEKHTPGGILN